MNTGPVFLLGMWMVLWVGGCTPAPDVPEGRWSGTVMLATGPTTSIPIETDVRYDDGLVSLTIDGLQGPSAGPISVRNPRVRGGALAFAFTEPQNLLLVECRIVQQPGGTFRGPCNDGPRRWATLTLRPPE